MPHGEGAKTPDEAQQGALIPGSHQRLIYRVSSRIVEGGDERVEVA